MGDGDHGWAAAEFCNVIRQALLLESQGQLSLFQGVPSEWLSEGNTVSIHNAPTFHGRVTATLESEAAGIWARWNLEPWAGEETTPLYLSLPRGLSQADDAQDAIHSQRRIKLKCALRGERFFPRHQGAVV